MIFSPVTFTLKDGRTGSLIFSVRMVKNVLKELGR